MADFKKFNGYYVKDEYSRNQLPNKINKVDTIADLKSLDADANILVETLGYHEVNDGGSGIYKIVNDENDELIDNGGTIHELNNGKKAILIINEFSNAKQFGAYGDDVHDDTTSLITMLSTLNYIRLTRGTYKTTQTITVHEKQSIYGEDKINTAIHYTGNDKCIASEDVSTCRQITIHDLTLLGTDTNGYGIYFVRSSKNSDTYHRLYNLEVKYFSTGIYLEKHLNEIHLSDIVCRYNNIGVHGYYLNDFYFERITTCVNNNSGLRLHICTEGRISDSKSWYNGSASPDGSFNVWMSSCLALMIVNFSCQESYGSNMYIGSSRSLSLLNCYFSLPGLNLDSTRYQLSLDAVSGSNIEVITADRYENDEYKNNILYINGACYNNIIDIIAEQDFPNNKVFSQGTNANRYNVCLRNEIRLRNDPVKYNMEINYAKNGDMRYTTDLTNFITQGQSYCSIVGGKLRVTAPSDSDATISFNYPTLPRTGPYVSYVKFRKVDGTGRVTIDYSGYVDVTAQTDTTTDLYASFERIKTSTASATNQIIKVGAGLTIDISEFGLVNGLTAKTGYPLYIKSIVE